MWPGDEAKTIQCTCMTLSEVWIDSGTLYMPLEPELEVLEEKFTVQLASVELAQVRPTLAS